MEKAVPVNEKEVTPTGLMHLGVIYVVWSSTYLAIRVAVREGAGFPPFTMGFMRVIAAGAILLLWAWFRKQRIKPTQRELFTIVVSGLLLWTGGNGLVMVGELRADSGLAALMVGALPIWTSLIEMAIDRKIPSFRMVIALLVGFAGIGVLAVPELTSGIQADALSVLALIGAAVSWGSGSVLQARRPVNLGVHASSAIQMLSGAVGFLALILILDEPPPTPTREAWIAWAYLVTIGGVLAFSSFVSALRLLPTNLVMTYAYVNPVLAVILGWWLLDEEITIWVIAGSILVLVGVTGVFRERYKKRRK